MAGGVYREQAYVERCACNEPAVAGCASCGRARCAYHLTRGLCVRCGEAIRRELARRSGGRFAGSMALGVVIALALLVAHSAAGIALGIPAAVAALLGSQVWQRRRLIRQLGPALSASKGELPPPSREPDPEPNTTTPGTDYTGGA